MQRQRRWFGTDGIRGTANREPVTVETMARLGRALGEWSRGGGATGPVVVGRDTRRSCDMVESALAAGLCAAGCDVLLVGVVPTPGVAWLTRALGAAAGAVVSASHNPAADNGVKVFDAAGFKLPEAAEAEIEGLMEDGRARPPAPTGSGIGRVRPAAEAVDRYVDALVASVGLPGGLRGLRVVLDCAHGAAWRVGPDVFATLGADVVTLGTAPDGDNINDGAGALHPEALQARVRTEKADLGVALDGDADRVVLADETGALVDGDEILAVLALEALAAGQLPGATVVGTVMSNLGLELALAAHGGRLVRTAVGDRYVAEAMRAGGYTVGGEPSGHVVLLEHATTGDGILTALQVAQLVLRRGERLGTLRQRMRRLPQVLRNVRVAAPQACETRPEVQAAIARAREALGARGRVVVRPSGTEPVVRVMVEGEDAERIRALAEEIAGALAAAGC